MIIKKTNENGGQSITKQKQKALIFLFQNIKILCPDGLDGLDGVDGFDGQDANDIENTPPSGCFRFVESLFFYLTTNRPSCKSEQFFEGRSLTF